MVQLKYEQWTSNHTKIVQNLWFNLYLISLCIVLATLVHSFMENKREPWDIFVEYKSDPAKPLYA